MAHKTIWKCDRCGEERETAGQRPNQWWCIAVFVNGQGSYFGGSYASPADGLQAEVCRPCLEAMGIHSKEKPKPETQPERMNRVEEIVRELLRLCADEVQP